MADNGFNGTTATFAAAALGDGVRSVRYSEGGADVDVSAGGDTNKTYEAGLTDIEVTIEFVGITTVSKGDKGAIAIAWNDGSSDAITNAICSSMNHGGNMDGELAGSATFKPSTAAGS